MTNRYKGSSSCEIARVVLSAPGCALFGRSNGPWKRQPERRNNHSWQQRKRLIKARGLKQAADRKVDFFFILLTLVLNGVVLS
jgi:hypothetical protein